MTQIFLTIAILFLAAIALYLLREDWHMLTSGRVRTRGKVTGHSRRTDEGSAYWSIKVRFVDDEGRAHEFTDTYGRATPTPDVGSIVPVIYPRGKPKFARVPRPLIRLVLYAFILGTLAIVVAKAAGWIEG